MSILEKTALEQQALNVIDRINAQQISPVIFFDTQQTSEPLPVTTSKVGGVPYVPVGTAAPTNGSGQNLGLIAQINCSELPTNDIYPETGILQFWLDPHEDLWGLNLDDPTSQQKTRVVYYPTLDTPDSGVGTAVTELIVNNPQDDLYWPVSGRHGYGLIAKSQSNEEWIFDGRPHSEFTRIWNDMYPEQLIASIWDLRKFDGGADTIKTLRDMTGTPESYTHHKIGGYPLFEQRDPRDGDAALTQYTVNLLTLISRVESGSHEGIMWGDMGTANWMVTSHQLKNRDFSKVLFEWS